MKDVEHSLAPPDPLDPLNSEQLSAVEHTDGPLLVIAGAGTGKTKVITRRIARLIERGIDPGSILALTFTEKAAGEMEERVDRLVPYGYTNVWISTFHSFGDRVLGDNALALGLVPDFKVLSEAERVIFLKEHLFDLPLDYYRPSGDPTRYLSSLVKFISRLKDEDVTPEDFLSYCDTLEEGEGGVTEDLMKERRELAGAYAKYEELMARSGYIDFGDQIVLPLKLFREKPAVLKRYRERYHYILTDEFQDTNYAQSELLKLLSGERRNITVVADDDQSIYKFRGAAISNVLKFQESCPEAKVVTLTRNYRSVQPVLDASYRLIRHNDPDRLEVKSGIDKKLVSERSRGGAGGEVAHLHFDTLTSEAEFVAKTIEERAGEGKRDYKEFAILVRANADAEPFLRALDQRGVPHRFSGSSGLYSREEIRVLISLLKVITDHSDSMNLFHLASSPVYGLKAADVMPCNHLSRRRHRPLFHVMRDVARGKDVPAEISTEGVETITKVVLDIERLSEMALKESTGRVLYTFLTDTGYIVSLSAEDSEEAVDSVRNIARFFEIVSHMEQSLSIKGKKVQTMVEYLTLLMD
ncbi:MAG: ATP-dependent helicase, partial [Thermodesulfobacteriota bacterium]